MAQGRCYVCTQMFTAKDKDAVIDKIVEHMMAPAPEGHHGYLWGDTMQTKNTFEKCPMPGMQRCFG